MTYVKTTWIDDDGSGTVGTPFSASAMNNIENFLDFLDGMWPGVPYNIAAGNEEADPGSGAYRTNAGITKLFISETDANGSAAGGFLNIWDDSTTTANRGHIIFRYQGGGFAVLRITGEQTDNGTWRTIPVALQAFGGTLTGPVSLQFYRTGDKGDAGTTGEKGATGSTGEKGATGANGRGIVACRVATTAALAAYTRTTNKLEANANGALAAVDGKSLAVGEYVQLNHGASKKDNGPYKVTSLGSAGAKWTMERVPEFDESSDIVSGMLIVISEGTVNANTLWVLTTNDPITLNTTELEFFVVTPRDFELVTSLTAATAAARIGDMATYKADATNGCYWRLVYDGEGEFPWKVIGGSPLFKEVEPEQEIDTATYSATGMTALEITVPLKGDYDISIGAYMLGKTAAAVAGRMSYDIGGAAASDLDAIVGINPVNAIFGIGSFARVKRQSGIAASTKFVAKYKGTPKVGYRARYMSIMPVRVG